MQRDGSSFQARLHKKGMTRRGGSGERGQVDETRRGKRNGTRRGGKEIEHVGQRRRTNALPTMELITNAAGGPRSHRYHHRRPLPVPAIKSRRVVLQTLSGFTSKHQVIYITEQASGGLFKKEENQKYSRFRGKWRLYSSCNNGNGAQLAIRLEGGRGGRKGFRRGGRAPPGSKIAAAS